MIVYHFSIYASYLQLQNFTIRLLPMYWPADFKELIDNVGNIQALMK